VIFVVHARTGINPDIEGLINGHEGRAGVRDRLAGYFLAVHRQDADATLGQSGAVIFKIKQDGVFTRRERLRAFPAQLFQGQEIVGEHGFALMTIDESFDVGVDTRTGVDDKDYKPPFRFTGKLDKLTIKLGPNQMMAEDQKAKAEAMARVND